MLNLMAAMLIVFNPDHASNCVPGTGDPAALAAQDFAPGLWFSIISALGLSLAAFAAFNWRWLLHVLGRGALQLQGGWAAPPRGLPFDWHCHAPPGRSPSGRVRVLASSMSGVSGGTYEGM